MCIDNYYQIVIINARLGALHWCGARGGYGLSSAALNYSPLANSRGFIT